MDKKTKRNIRAQEIIWNFLFDHAGEKFYLTQISQKTKISDSTVHQILESQVTKGLVKKEKLGNLSLYFIDQSNPAIKLKKKLRVFLKVQHLVDQLKEWSQKIILYGSAALGEDTAESDIDLFVLSDEKDQVYKVFSQAKMGDKNKVKLVVKNFLEWTETKKKDKFFFNQINKGIVLWEKNEMESCGQ